MSEFDLGDHYQGPEDELPHEVEIVMPSGYVEYLDTTAEVYHDGNGNIHYFEQVIYDEHSDDYTYVQNLVLKGGDGQFYILRFDDDIIHGTQYEYSVVHYDEEHDDFSVSEDIHTKNYSQKGALSFDTGLQEVCVRLETGEKYVLGDLLANNGIVFYQDLVERPSVPLTPLPTPSVDIEKIPIMGRRNRGHAPHYRRPFVESPRTPASKMMKEQTSKSNYLKYLLIFTLFSYLGFQLVSGNLKFGNLVNQVPGYGDVDDDDLTENTVPLPTEAPTPVQQIVTTENCEMGTLKDEDGIVSPVGPGGAGGGGEAHVGTDLWYGNPNYDPKHDNILERNIYGAPVYSVEAGKVIYVYKNETQRWNPRVGSLRQSHIYGDVWVDYGNVIYIQHADGVSIYAHLNQDGLFPIIDQCIAKGQQIAEIGFTGNSNTYHLHFEVRTNPNCSNYSRYCVENNSDATWGLYGFP